MTKYSCFSKSKSHSNDLLGVIHASLCSECNVQIITMTDSGEGVLTTSVEQALPMVVSDVAMVKGECDEANFCVIGEVPSVKLACFTFDEEAGVLTVGFRCFAFGLG